MSKRSSTFERHARDYYPTPPEAVLALLPRLKNITLYDEPCAGDGALMIELGFAGKRCVIAGDIEPQGVGIKTQDALEIKKCGGAAFITNPPWSRDILHKLIAHLSAIAPTYFLMDAAWAHTKQAIPFMEYCCSIISVGRLKWIAGSPHAGKDDAAWFLFNQNAARKGTRFYARRSV